MADNITLNAMTGGSVVATDDSGATGHVQIIKLAISADGSATIIPADATYGLDVDVTRLPALAAGTNSIGTTKRTHQPTPYKLLSAATTNATNVSSTANTLLYGYFLSNLNGAAWRYVKFYNKASAPTVGTDTPVLVLAIPPSGAANASFPAGVNFTTGLSFAITAGVADSDTTAVAANEVVINLAYAVY